MELRGEQGGGWQFMTQGSGPQFCELSFCTIIYHEYKASRISQVLSHAATIFEPSN